MAPPPAAAAAALPPIPPVMAGAPINTAPAGYFEACRAHGLRPCVECRKLPLCTIIHRCDTCDGNLHAYCGASVVNGRNRCLSCCREIGVPDGAENPAALALQTAGTTTTTTMTTTTIRPTTTIHPTTTPPTTTTTTTNRPSHHPRALATIPVNLGPNRVGIDPGAGNCPTRVAAPSPQVATTPQIIATANFSPAPAEAPKQRHSRYHSTLI